MAVKCYQSIVEYWDVENAGIFTVNEDKNKPEEKRQELCVFMEKQ